MSTPVIILIVTVVIGAGCIIGCYFLAKRGAFLAINEKLITRIDKAIFPDEFHGIMIHLKSIRQTMGGASCRVSSAFISAARLLADKMDTPMLEELEKVTSLEGLKEYREKFKKMFEPLDLYLAFDGSPWTDWHACTDCPKWFIAFKKKTLELIKEKKHDRQIIFASHNANFVINGDSELIQILSLNENGTTIILPTSIENEATRKQLIELDGGEEAFIKRERKYKIKANL